MLKIQGKEVGQFLTDIQLKLVRTYRGEIQRTQTGRVSAFPTSFVMPGFDLQFIGPRNDIKQLEQLFLSANTLEVVIERAELSIKGAFSCTTNQTDELRDKGERSVQLGVSIVSDGTNITKPDGSAFAVKVGTTNIVTGYFAKVVAIPSAYASYKLNGFSLPNRQILLLGDCTLTN